MKVSAISIVSVGIVALHAAPANAQQVRRKATLLPPIIASGAPNQGSPAATKSAKRGTSSPTSDTLTSTKSAKAAALLFPKSAKASVSTSSPTSDTLGSKSSKGVFGKSSKGSKAPSKSGKEPYDVKSEVNLMMEESCEYELEYSFKFDENLPVPNDPAMQCDPRVQPPVLAPDGKPYYATREFNIALSKKIFHPTGFASIGLDYQACGHPPLMIFAKEHFDVHFYTESKEIRDGWTCDLQGPPVCNPPPAEQPNVSGRKFFNVATIWDAQYDDTDSNSQPANMPDGFICDKTAAVPNQGLHCWDYANQPASVAEWEEPVLIMGNYDAKIAFFEPMVPVSFLTGETNNTFAEDVSYKGQTIETLPFEYSVEYNAGDGRASVTLKGRARGC